MVLSQDFSDSGATEDGLTCVGLGKFSDEIFVRAHPEFHQGPIPIMRLKEDLPGGQRAGEIYYVKGPALKMLSNRVRPTKLFVLITRQRANKVWPIVMDSGEGRWNIAHESATKAAHEAMDRWVQISSKLVD